MPTDLLLNRWARVLAAIKMHVAVSVLRSPFDVRALPTYILIAIKAALGIALALVLDFTIRFDVFAVVIIWLLIALSGMMLRRLNWLRLGGAMEAFALLYGQGFSSIPLLAAMAALNAPWADSTLSSWDKSIGFSWTEAIVLMTPYIYSLEIAYDSFLWQGWVIVFSLFFVKQERRAWILVCAATLTMLCTALIFAYFPAKAAFVHYGFKGFEGHTVPFSFLEPLEYIRSGGRELSRGLISGFVSFPSYHSSAAVLFTWAMWKTPVRFLFLALNIGLLLGTIIIGGHYLVDILAGVALAVFAIWVSHFLVRELSQSLSGLESGYGADRSRSPSPTAADRAATQAR